jgi:hypothetical protein
MKTISDQLKDLGLKHGDLCEIEGVEGRLVVRQTFRDLSAESDKDIYRYDDMNYKVTCGWRKSGTGSGTGRLTIDYLQVFPAPIPKPLPEAVEAVVEFCNESEQREFARAMLAEVEKMIEARLK